MYYPFVLFMCVPHTNLKALMLIHKGYLTLTYCFANADMFKDECLH